MSDATRFRPGEARTIACAKKGRAASPLGRKPIPLNRNAKRTLRLAIIKQIARKP